MDRVKSDFCSSCNAFFYEFLGTIFIMYAIAGVVIGYFSIYFLVEMKREYGD